ncbi:hypothetical protein NA29_02260 [Pandoraea sputorum]|nr:hypothetical protein NA29_02260 [Pandoraea sputorum]
MTSGEVRQVNDERNNKAIDNNAEAVCPIARHLGQRPDGGVVTARRSGVDSLFKGSTAMLGHEVDCGIGNE